MGPVIRTLGTSRNFTMSQTCGRSEKQMLSYHSGPMSGPVAFKQITVSDVILTPSIEDITNIIWKYCIIISIKKKQNKNPVRSKKIPSGQK